MGSCLLCSKVDANTLCINGKLQQEEKLENNTYKLLFLGPGGSGKSTIFKQLQWLHGVGFTEEDAALLKEHIYYQVITQMKQTIIHYLAAPPILIGSDQKIDEKLQCAIDAVQEYENAYQLDDDIANNIKYIWQNDKRLNNIFEKHFAHKILDESTKYFWDSIERLNEENYIPDCEDILNVRYRSTGVSEKKFTINGRRFHIFDVGGQENERKKWIHCFDGVEAVVFVVSLSCYNEIMYEDETKNCMDDSLQLFEEIVNNKYFKQSPIILFLNKTDLFTIKLEHGIHLNECQSFGDFEGDTTDFLQSTRFIEAKFNEKNHQERKIYMHCTCAMNKKNIENVFSDVTQMIMRKNLTGLSLM